jgi:hypothetical protein
LNNNIPKIFLFLNTLKRLLNRLSFIKSETELMNNTNNMNNPNKKRHNNNYGKNRSRQRFTPEKPSINKVYDSNGPGGRQRGNASTLYEKYTTLARDAHSAGDRVLSENYMQYAEHYLRIVNSIQEQLQSVYREQYRDAEQGGDESYNNMQQHDSFQEPKYNMDMPINTEAPSADSEKLEQFSSDDLSKDKPIIRRKIYPYARRKPYEQSQNGGHNTNHNSNYNSHDIASQATISDTHTQSNESTIHNKAEHHAEFTDADAIKPRRVVRRRSLTPKSSDEHVTDAKNAPLEE